ncbi:MAG: biotin/lipoyl-containing protein, partial [Elusimicrobiota bacterium]
MASKKTKEREPGCAPGALEELRDLYRFMVDNGLEAVEIDRKDSRVKLVRRSSRPVQVPVPVLAAGAPAAATPSAPSAPPAAAAGTAPLPPNAAVVKAPMMGIFYRAASPSSPPFAKEGDEVKAGDVLCLIEA